MNCECKKKEYEWIFFIEHAANLLPLLVLFRVLYVEAYE